jgi:hypothetical protein
MLAELQTIIPTQTRQIDIEFLFLDLTTCTRCVGTGENLETALDKVAQVLDSANMGVNIRKVLIETAAQAQAHHFITSPTIRVNGRDIALDTRESLCDSCTELCGCEEGTNCRVWLYQGQEYNEAPVGLIVEAILQEAFRTDAVVSENVPLYDEVPANLTNFFAAKDDSASCCSATTQAVCCEPSAKDACCGETAVSGSCGCQ